VVTTRSGDNIYNKLKLSSPPPPPALPPLASMAAAKPSS